MGCVSVPSAVNGAASSGLKLNHIFAFFQRSLMKASTKMVSRCMYLSILLQTKSHDVLNRYAVVPLHASITAVNFKCKLHTQVAFLLNFLKYICHFS